MFTVRVFCQACGRDVRRDYEEYMPIGSVRCECGVTIEVDTQSETHLVRMCDQAAR